MTIMTTFTAIVSARTTLVSAPLLQPIGIGILVASGFAALLQSERRRRGEFCFGLHYVRSIMKDAGWKYVKPKSDSQKLPSDWRERRELFVLHLAYLVLVHEIPRALCLNGDHTSVHYAQHKGKAWMTKQMLDDGDKSMQRYGDKRVITVLATSCADGDLPNLQCVMQGKTRRAIPTFGSTLKNIYQMTVSALNTVGKLTVCFTMAMVACMGTGITGISSFVVTYNHWSDNISSRAYVTDVVVPYLRNKIKAMREADPSSCKEFGEQICVLIVDSWWGWLNAGFRQWVSTKYPWLKLLFVPANCTSVAQPMDAGVIARLKGRLRRKYGKWAVDLAVKHMQSGGKPEDIKVPHDVPTCLSNLLRWLSASVEELRSDKAGIVHCWESTQLLCAWDRGTQMRAVEKMSELYPDVTAAAIPALIVEAEHEEDPSAAQPGLPFDHTEDPVEWVSYVEWETVPPA